MWALLSFGFRRVALLTHDRPAGRIGVMMRDLDQLTSTSLRAALAGHPFVTAIIYRPCLGSTNDLAKEKAGAGVPEGLLVIADEQTAGRGRLGRRWWAPAGSALLTSLLFRPATPSWHGQAGAGSLQLAPQLVMLCALAAADAVTDLTGLDVDLKWPNDLLVRGRKLAGLLAESVFTGDRLDAVVVGLGLNVATDLGDAPPFMASATSLQLELGHPVDRLPLLVAYVSGVARRYAQLERGTSPYTEWASRLVTLGQHVTAHLGDPALPGKDGSLDATPRSLSGVAQGVDVDGALLLRAPDGTVHRLLAADITLRPSI